ncbi:unnamed protein product [Nesidiocoris tenuis]|uniref:Uncharacterized protein n=1 Tax=Nesidiocoris tenuis TaxID=355587 RepID=A0A6H5GK06_9HEMI|nr:unnamed protein product [Nesidiocoris tenuis]
MTPTRALMSTWWYKAAPRLGCLLLNYPRASKGHGGKHIAVVTQIAQTNFIVD